MTKVYTITLSDAEDKALSVVSVDQNEWIQNAIHHRCQVAIDEIVNHEIQRKLAAGEPISGTKEEIVLSADIETAVERNARLEEEYRNLQEQQG